MGDYTNEKSRLKRIIDDGLKSLKDQVRDDFRANPDFKRAVPEENNDENNWFITEIIRSFGLVFTPSDDYTQSINDSNIDISKLLDNLKVKVDAIVVRYQDKMKKEVDNFVTEVLMEIEKSDFLSQVVKNEHVPYKEANKELKKL